MAVSTPQVLSSLARVLSVSDPSWYKITGFQIPNHLVIFSNLSMCFSKYDTLNQILDMKYQMHQVLKQDSKTKPPLSGFTVIRRGDPAWAGSAWGRWYSPR